MVRSPVVPLAPAEGGEPVGTGYGIGEGNAERYGRSAGRMLHGPGSLDLPGDLGRKRECIARNQRELKLCDAGGIRQRLTVASGCTHGNAAQRLLALANLNGVYNA